MNASWPMVFGALLAGTVGGFMIPVRPEIRDVPALTASKATDPAKKEAGDDPARAAAKAEIRKIPLTQAASKDAAQDSQTEERDRADTNACAEETWPYRSANCLDRTATVAPADTVVTARRVDPVLSLGDKVKQEPKQAAASESASASETAAPEPVKPQQKTVSAPAAREDRSERAAPPAEQVSAPSSVEPRAESVNARQEAAKSNQPRRATRPSNRDTVEFDDGIPTRVYLRGPDGRLYLAPEYRPSGRTVYYVR